MKFFDVLLSFCMDLVVIARAMADFFGLLLFFVFFTGKKIVGPTPTSYFT